MVIRKRFGQHFLHDPAVIRRIIDAVAPTSGERVVELGPGRGALTFGLLERAQRLDAIEIDRDLARLLEADPRAQGRLRLHVENMLDTDFALLRGQGEKLRIVGNLPYNVSTPVLFHLLSQRGAIEDMHFMLQKEVVDRMSASPGGKQYAPLSFACVRAPSRDSPSAATPRSGRLRQPPSPTAARPCATVLRAFSPSRTSMPAGSMRNCVRKRLHRSNSAASP